VYITVVDPQLTRRCMARPPMEGPDDDSMGDGHERPWLPPARGQTWGPGAQRRPLGSRGGMGDVGPARAQGAMAPAGFPRPRFPGPLVVARGHPRPQADGRLAVPKRRLSGPHSATNRAAPRWSTPGMVSSTARA
jgi:hypothetical protein